MAISKVLTSFLYPTYYFRHVEGNYSNDICIVITDRPFEFNNLISPLPLGDEQSCRPGQACQVAGFGAMKVCPRNFKLYTRPRSFSFVHTSCWLQQLLQLTVMLQGEKISYHNHLLQVVADLKCSVIL